MEFMFHNLYAIEWIVSITFIFWRAQLLTQKSFATFDDLVIILIRKEISLHIILSKFMIHHWMWKEALLYNTMREWSCSTPNQFFSYISQKKLHWMKWGQPLCTRPTHLEFYSAISLKQQSAGRQATPLRHMILIPSRPVFDLAPLYGVLSGEAANTNLIVLGLTRPGFKSTIYSTNRCDFCTICMFSCILLIPWCSQTLQQSCFYCTNGPVFIFIMILITV